MKTLNFRNLPGYPEIFLDFVDDAPALRELFPCRPEVKSLLGHSEKMMSARSFPRESLCRALRRQAAAFGSGSRAHRNIDRLTDPKTVVIAASYRACLLGGPLTALLKCLTAIKLASELESLGARAVPVCWMDLEASSAPEDQTCFTLLDSDSGLKSMAFSSSPDAYDPRAALDGVLSHLEGALSLGPDPLIRDLLVRTYSRAPNSRLACGMLLSGLTADWGLILIDPDELHREMPDGISEAPDAEAWEGFERHRATVLRNAGYENGDAQARSREASGYHAATLALKLPVVAHVADPEEFRPFASVVPFLQSAGLPSPAVWPRVSATVLDARSRKLLERYGLTVRSLFAGRDELLSRTGLDGCERETLRRWEHVEELIRGRLGEIRGLVPAEEDLAERLEVSLKRMTYQVGKLRRKLGLAAGMRRDAARRQLERLCNSLTPLGRRQETVISGVHFLARHSAAFLGKVYEQMDPRCLEHQILAMD